MAVRKIVEIDDEKYNGVWIPYSTMCEGGPSNHRWQGTPYRGKFFDGLGPCLGHCPEDAITLGGKKKQLSWEMKRIKPGSPR